jgi:phosphoribosylformylglycinamidine (FGAM) synthase-like enzyme
MQINGPQVTNQLAVQLGLTEDEFEMIKEQLGRTPNLIELQIYSVMWSERSSFKNALHWLKTLPLESPHILPGKEVQDLKLIDIGEGMVGGLHFHSIMPPKMGNNGHIHPFSSLAVAHYSFAQLGLAPLATLNSLRMGGVENENNKKLLITAAQQLSYYHNAFGIPTVGGEVYFDHGYQDYPVFDLFSFTLDKAENIHSSNTTWNDLPVFLAGRIRNPSAPPEPTSDRNLLNAVLDAVREKQIHSVQTMPIGGLGRAAAHLSWKTKTGIKLDLEPLQSQELQKELPALLWSGCKECLLLVGEKEKASDLKSIFQKWEVRCEPLGHLTDTDKMQVYLQNEKIADLSPSSLILESNTSSKQNAYEKPDYIKKIRKYNPNRIPKPSNYFEVAQKIWQSPNVISRKWIYEQFDSKLGNNTLSNISSDAALLRIKGSRRAIALSMDCNPYYVFADPYVGAMIAVCEAARNITCSGGDIKAMQYGLHFGDPDRGDDYWQFVNAIKGIGDACRKFEIPVTGGDVRFHPSNERRSPSQPFLPTPVVGMMGVIDDVDNLMSPEFKESGHQIYMLGTPYNDFASSEYLRLIHDVQESSVPKFELDEEYHNLYNLKVIIRKKLIQSAHDISEGGLMTALLEAALPHNLGFDIETDSNFRKDAYLFGESQGRIIVTVTPDNEDELVNYLNSHNVSFSKLGEVVGRRVIVDNQDFGFLKDWKSIHEQTLSEKLDK